MLHEFANLEFLKSQAASIFDARWLCMFQFAENMYLKHPVLYDHAFYLRNHML